MKPTPSPQSGGRAYVGCPTLRRALPRRHPCRPPPAGLHLSLHRNSRRCMYDLTGKICVITGAASGMGKAAAILFASKGANVVLADLNTKGGEEAAAEASAAG